MTAGSRQCRIKNVAMGRRQRSKIPLFRRIGFTGTGNAAPVKLGSWYQMVKPI